MAPVTRSASTRPTMVGRVGGLRSAGCAGWLATPRGRRRSHWWPGEPGTGKTRLVDEAGKCWADAGIRVLSGSCRAADGPPYLPLAGALRRALLPTAPVLRALTAGQAAGRLELFELLSSAVAGLSADRPLLLVVGDLHWSDRATREALAWLACESSPGRWGLVVTHRYEGPLTSNELAAFTDLLGQRVTTRVSLEPLSEDQVGELATALGAASPDDDTVARLHRRTGGIPLLVEEVVAAGDTHVPEHLRSVFRARAAAAGPGVVTALHVVAVAGECDELVVAAALGADAAEAAAALGRAVEADLLWVDARGYRFRHDLLREAMYDDAAPGRRRELHGQVARILASRGAAPIPRCSSHHGVMPGTRPRWCAPGWPRRRRPSGACTGRRAPALHQGAGCLAAPRRRPCVRTARPTTRCWRGRPSPRKGPVRSTPRRT